MADGETEVEVKCKVLEWLYRGAHKTQPFHRQKDNAEFHKFMRNGINSFLMTRFSYYDIERIYQHLGNRVNHEKTVKFVESGYDMRVLEEDKA